ncbi:MAG: hypothetical protein WDZ37_02630 [Solirubrobacterales bacterium]
MRIISKATLTSMAVLAAAAGTAHAGSYDVYACGGPAGNAQSAFRPAADPLMSAYSICPASNIATGVVTKVRSDGGVAPYLSGAYQVFDAPPGNTLESTTLSIAELRMEKHWTVGIVAYDQFDGGEVVFGCQAWLPGCDIATPAFYGPVTVGLGGRRSFRLETRCGSLSGCSATSTGKTPANRAIFSATQISVRVRDDGIPRMRPIGGNAWMSGWHRGIEAVQFTSADWSGIRLHRLYVNGALEREDDLLDARWPAGIRCDYTRPQPCTSGTTGSMDVDTKRLPDGENRLRLEAVDPAGNVGASQRTIRVDNTAPAKVSAATVENGDGWRRSNGYSVGWENPPGQIAPIDRAHYSLCPAGGGACVDGERAGEAIVPVDTPEAQPPPAIDRIDSIEVPEPGDYELRVWLRDAAGNADHDRASDALHLRFDDRPPAASFESQALSDPLAVKLSVSDAHSGVTSAAIEIRRAGTDEWHAMETQFAGPRAAARIDDLALRDGVYELRARVADRAGNETVTDHRGDGSKMELRLPLRSTIRIDVHPGLVVERSTCRRQRRRRCPALKPVTTRSDGSSVLRGRVSSPSGDALAGIQLSVMERARTGQPLSRSALRTDESGRFVHHSGAGPSRVITFEYEGDRITRPAVARSELRVRARSSIGVTPRRSSSGRAVAFAGRLGGGFVPPGGKLVHLQAHYRGRWRTFATPRTSPNGAWRHRYRFGATVGRLVYRFRAAIPREAAYPFESARSRTVRVVVRE